MSESRRREFIIEIKVILLFAYLCALIIISAFFIFQIRVSSNTLKGVLAAFIAEIQPAWELIEQLHIRLEARLSHDMDRLVRSRQAGVVKTHTLPDIDLPSVAKSEHVILPVELLPRPGLHHKGGDPEGRQNVLILPLRTAGLRQNQVPRRDVFLRGLPEGVVRRGLFI